MPPVAASESERIKQPWDAMIEHRAIVAARLVAQRAGDPTFAGSGRAADQQILPAGNPFTGDELGEQPLVKAARSFRVDVLDDGVVGGLRTSVD